MSHCRGTVQARCWRCEKTFRVANGLCTHFPVLAFHHSYASHNFRISPMTPDISIQVEANSYRKVSVALNTVIWVSFGAKWTWSIICDARPMTSMLRLPIRIWWHQGCTMMKVTYAKTSRVDYDVWMIAMLIAALNAMNLFSAGLVWLL